MSVPKIIHYCWFGGNPKPKLAEKCIKSWKKFCPDYQIIEWNEENFDVSAAPEYVCQAYAAKRWAFVTDYVRLKAMTEMGGIYMDTDVELVKPLTPSPDLKRTPACRRGCLPAVRAFHCFRNFCSITTARAL